MILIAHRANIHGPNPELENSPDYILKALSQGYYVEIDVWYHNDKLWLGHDKPDYLTDINFLKKDRMICHCKNIEALPILLKNNIHCFFHDIDDATLTSQGKIWLYPGKNAYSDLDIIVMPERTNYGLDFKWLTNLNAYGVCSDYVDNISKI